jgi:hypothetical protein
LIVEVVMASTEHIEAKLCAYVDGELDAQGRAEIEQHLATNAQHRALLEELMRQREVVRALPRERAPEDLYENFSAQLERSVLLDEPDDSEIHIAGRINRWPQMYAAAAVILLVVGLAAVIYMVLPGGSGSHTPPQFVIGPTTTGPVKLAEIPEDTDAGVARKDEAKAETVDTFSLAATTPGAKTSADNLAKAQGDIFKQKSDTTVAPAKTGALAGVPAALAPKQQVHDLFDSDLKTHVQTITNGEVKDPVFVVVSTQNPVVAQSEVTQFLGQNKIVWQPIAQPMPAPVELSANDVLEGARGQQQTQRRLKAQTREADNIVTGSGNGSGPYRAASSASPAPATPATVTPTAMPALGPATREAIVQDSSTVWNVAPSAGATLLGR